MLKNILGALEAATGIPVKPFGTDSSKDCIIYRWSCQRDDGCLAQYRLELRLITKTVKAAQQNEKKIRRALVDLGDTHRLTGASIEQNGGGTLRDDGTGTIHTLFYFDVKTRSDL